MDGKEPIEHVHSGIDCYAMMSWTTLRLTSGQEHRCQELLLPLSGCLLGFKNGTGHVPDTFFAQDSNVRQPRLARTRRTDSCQFSNCFGARKNTVGLSASFRH